MRGLYDLQGTRTIIWDLLRGRHHVLPAGLMTGSTLRAGRWSPDPAGMPDHQVSRCIVGHVVKRIAVPTGKRNGAETYGRLRGRGQGYSCVESCSQKVGLMPSVRGRGMPGPSALRRKVDLALHHKA